MRKRKILAVFLIVFTVLLSSFAFYTYQLIYTPNVLVESLTDETFSIDRGDTFSDVQKKLGDSKMVNDLMAFSFVAKIMGYHKAVKPGHYVLTPNMTSMDAIRILKRGNPTVRVRFHTARRLENLAATFAKYLYLDSAELMQYFTQEEVQQEYGFNRENMVGLFLPDTYEFYYEASGADILNKMKRAYESFWTEERLQKAENLGLTPQEVSTLASIVLAETAQVDEAPKIAGLYKNRLDNGMRLQADPTLIFAQNDYSIRRVKKGDREIESPYNTYKYKGLPPGPIRMPSKAYLDAVLDMEEHEYLYFCADASFNGYHLFAKDYDDHLKNARKLWRALNQRGIER